MNIWLINWWSIAWNVSNKTLNYRINGWFKEQQRIVCNTIDFIQINRWNLFDAHLSSVDPMETKIFWTPIKIDWANRMDNQMIKWVIKKVQNSITTPRVHIWHTPRAALENYIDISQKRANIGFYSFVYALNWHSFEIGMQFKCDCRTLIDQNYSSHPLKTIDIEHKLFWWS